MKPAKARSPGSSRGSVELSAMEKLTNTLEDISEVIHSKFNESTTAMEYGEDLNSLSARDSDIIDLMDDENFHNLQLALRRRGCVTNNYLQMNIYKYVAHVRRRREQETQVLQMESEVIDSRRRRTDSS